MALEAGRKLGLYEILAPIGAGGMGEVYRARDTKLDREVALKVLPPELVANPDRKRRFVQEARSARFLGQTCESTNSSVNPGAPQQSRLRSAIAEAEVR